MGVEGSRKKLREREREREREGGGGGREERQRLNFKQKRKRDVYLLLDVRRMEFFCSLSAFFPCLCCD